MGEFVTLDVADGVGTIRLDRPKMNAISFQVQAELREAAAEATERDDVRAVVLYGGERVFAAGADINELQRDYPRILRRAEQLSMVCTAVARLPKPVIAAVNGVAAGAGANLALACDIVLAARSARFIQAFCRIGLVPDCGGTWFLPRLVGTGRAAALAMLGEAVSAKDAASWGMIWRVVDDVELMPEAERLAGHLARQPTKTLALIKRALDASWRSTLDEQLDLERDLQREAGKTEDYREGVAAFLEKRSPRFAGR
jgi:2-(1,2-epoxy-1,2-dihydrophenyl)acetyl-CoA isomerase